MSIEDSVVFASMSINNSLREEVVIVDDVDDGVNAEPYFCTSVMKPKMAMM